MALFSLITITMGNRATELKRLRDSLARQTCRDFEHIVIDQREHPEFENSLSRARNFGISLARGEIIAFPDDDAWYATTILEDVRAYLADPQVDGVSFRVTSAEGQCSAGGYMSPFRMKMSRATIWRTAVSCSFFVKRQVLGSSRFDERLGVGSSTKFGSGEETDFLLTLLSQGARFVYDGTKTIYHPLSKGPYSGRKGWLYGNGCGAVLRKHKFSFARLIWMISTQLIRTVQASLSLNPSKARFHFLMALGRLSGYLTYPVNACNT